MRPELLTFDVFGTLLDWRAGLERDLAARGVTLPPERFEAILAVQERLEHEAFRPYAEVVALSLVEAAGLGEADAAAVGANVGRWPAYADTAAPLRRLVGMVPCVAMTNSDRVHGEQVQAGLGFRLSDWVCAEDVHVYKPDARFWRAVAFRLRRPLDAAWWHVSAYADYDLATARSLGLTTVFVNRPHARPGEADHAVANLYELADLVSAAGS